ncbi:MAG: hypothetical protein JNK75_04820 [Betaproteobacteria bacterium]|nr:hypothetical protein [Betaproteobacteria bacterium]
MRTLIIALFSLAATLAQASPPELKVPAGRAVLVDGRCEAEEWAGAATIPLGSGALLRAQQAGEYVYLCVQPAAPSRFGVDAYFARTGQPVLNLHVSAKLGERVAGEKGFPDWAWWNNVRWTGNPTRPNRFDRPDFQADEAKELQIHRTRLAGAGLRMMLEVHSDATLTYPADAKAGETARWMAIQLD